MKGTMPVEVKAELAYMVVLPEETLTFLGVGDTRVLEGVDIRVDRHQKNGPATGFQNSLNLRKGLVRVADMLQHMVADDHVVSVARLVDGRHVEMEVGNGRIEVGGGVVEVLQGAETLQERLFGREMQDLQRRGEEVRLLLQVEPQQTVPFKRQALGAHSIVGRRAIPVGQELAEVAAADGAFHLVAPIERPDQPAEEVAHPDEPLAWEDLGEE